ncbi:hypothetical protein T484DRAFT_1800023, partial [Baffinella frigidus]
RVLALALLLSAHVVYNGVSLLDASRIQELTAIRKLILNMRVREGAGEEDGIGFKEVFPRLTFVLRGVHGELLDERGNPISPQAYLERASVLRGFSNGRVVAYLERALVLRGFSEEAEAKNSVRKMIVSFLLQRD